MIHTISTSKLDRDHYSDSVLDLATTFYFREDQEIRVSPKYTQYPTTDFLSSCEAAQSASEKLVTGSKTLEE